MTILDALKYRLAKRGIESKADDIAEAVKEMADSDGCGSGGVLNVFIDMVADKDDETILGIKTSVSPDKIVESFRQGKYIVAYDNWNQYTVCVNAYDGGEYSLVFVKYMFDIYYIGESKGITTMIVDAYVYNSSDNNWDVVGGKSTIDPQYAEKLPNIT